MISTEECKFEVSVKQDLLEVYFPIIYQPEKKNYCMGKKEGILFFCKDSISNGLEQNTCRTMKMLTL